MKKTQIIIITISLILTLGCVGTFAVLYFATDTFKSEQEMFYKYASQMDLKQFINLENYITYTERLKATGQANEGEFSVEIAQGGQKISEAIKYNGYTDPVNKNSNYDISITQNEQTMLSMNYLKNQDFYGIQFKDILSQYIVVENNNLKEFASKLGIQDTSEIPNKIEIPESNINYEELNTILNKYLNTAIQEIPENNYSKIKKVNISLGEKNVEADGYQAELKVRDVQKILTKVLEQARDDEEIFNLLNNENITFEEYQEIINELLLSVSEEISNEENTNLITIRVYKQGKNTIKLSLNIIIDEESNAEISIENTDKGMMLKLISITEDEDGTKEENIVTITKTINTEEQENFEIVLKQISEAEETELVNVSISRNGMLTSNRVKFNTIATTTIQGITAKVEMESDTNFSGVPLEGKIEQGNHLVINGLPAEQITNLFTNLGNILAEKLKDEMFVKLITNLTTVNSEELYQVGENTFEQENDLANGIVEVNNQDYDVNEYANSL